MVDDNIQICHGIQRILLKAGYEVSLSFSIKDCRNILKSLSPDLIILDVILEDGNGLTLVEELSKNEAYSHIPVLLMSGHQIKENDKSERLFHPAIDVIYKPIRNKDLLQRLEIIFKTQNLERHRLEFVLKYDYIFRSVNDILIVADSDGLIRESSRSFEKLFGKSADELKDRCLKNLVYSDDQDIWETSFRKALAGIIVPSFEIRFLTHNKKIASAEINLSGTTLGDLSTGKGVLIIAKDLSQLRLMESEFLNGDARTRNERNREISSWTRLSETRTSETMNSYEVSAFLGNNPELLGKMIAAYRNIIEKAIEQRIYKTSEDSSLSRKNFANELGFFKARPKDLIYIHSEIFKEVLNLKNPKKISLYHEEARIILLEIMGYLASYYRNRNS